MSAVLIIEDELIVATSYKVFLQKNNYEIAGHASTKENAIKEFDQCKPDIVLLDLRLKNDDNGLDVARHIRNKYNTPIIFTTGNPRAITMEEIKSIANSVVLNKPIDNGVLLNTMTKLIR